MNECLTDFTSLKNKELASALKERRDVWICKLEMKHKISTSITASKMHPENVLCIYIFIYKLRIILFGHNLMSCCLAVHGKGWLSRTQS